jgi:TPR repeat protein
MLGYELLPERARLAWEEHDFVRAFEYIMPLAEQGNPAAQCIIGSIYDLGLGRPEDFSEAVKWYRRAADQGHPIACNNLEAIYLSGMPSVPQDREMAGWYRQKAIENGLDIKKLLKIKDQEDG